MFREGFQGGAVMATGFALMMVSGIWDDDELERQAHKAHRWETLGLLGFFLVAFLGACLGVSSANYYRAQEGTNAEPANRLHGDLAEPKQPEE